MRYTYLSDGTKVSALDAAGDGLLYRGNFVYEKDGQNVSLESISWDEGRIRNELFQALLHDDEPIDVTDTLAVLDSLPGLPWHPKEPFFPGLLAEEGHWVEADTTELVLGPAIDREPLYQDQWFVRDHLGNVRSVIDLTRSAAMPADSVILEQNDYLPYGMKSSTSSLSTDSAFRYRYAGKEEQRFGAFDSQLLDFGARYYDAYTCRWNAIDPLANNFYNRTPYNYCGNDPVNRFDSDGRVEIVVRTAVGVVVGAAIGGIVAYSTGKNGKEFWGSVANGAVAGGVTAATAGLGGNIAVTQLFTGAATGAIAGASGTATEQLITEGHLDGVEIAKGAAEGAVNGVITRGVSKIAQTAVNNSAASINSKYTAGSKEMKAITKEVQSEMKEQGFSISGKSGKQELRQRVFQRASTFKKVETSAAATTINAAKEIHNYGSSAVREVIYENQKK